jgi:polyhydroxybutyrate depolymerase
VVPLEGRPIGEEPEPLIQGDVFAGLAIWRDVLGCAPNPDAHEVEDAFWLKGWTTCAEGGLTLVLFPDGHVVPEGWTDFALDWFEDYAR